MSEVHSCMSEVHSLFAKMVTPELLGQLEGSAVATCCRWSWWWRKTCAALARGFTLLQLPLMYFQRSSTAQSQRQTAQRERVFQRWAGRRPDGISSQRGTYTGVRALARSLGALLRAVLSMLPWGPPFAALAACLGLFRAGL